MSRLKRIVDANKALKSAKDFRANHSSFLWLIIFFQNIEFFHLFAKICIQISFKFHLYFHFYKSFVLHFEWKIMKFICCNSRSSFFFYILCILLRKYIAWCKFKIYYCVHRRDVITIKMEVFCNNFLLFFYMKNLLALKSN